MNWKDSASIERLRALWAEGLSTAEIGRRMGATKNSVVGAAHRLNLPSRPSPIKPGVNAKPAQPRSQVRAAATASVIAALLPSLPAPVAATLEGPSERVRTTVRTTTRTTVRAVLDRPFAAVRRCQYPLWGDGERPGPSPRFCDAPVGRRADGSPLVYCREHHARCHGPGTRSERTAVEWAEKAA